MRSVPIHQSLHRHDLTLGGERDLVLGTVLFCVVIAFGGMTVLSAVVALSLWFASITALRRMAKADPQMSRVWVRHLRQQDYYPARSTPWCRDGEKR